MLIFLVAKSLKQTWSHMSDIFFPYCSFDKLEKRRNKVWWWYLMLLSCLAQKYKIADSPKMREVCMPYKYSFCLKEIKGLVFLFRNLANPAPCLFGYHIHYLTLSRNERGGRYKMFFSTTTPLIYGFGCITRAEEGKEEENKKKKASLRFPR